MQYKELTIKSEDGLKGKNAAMFVQSAGKFESQVLIECGNKKVNAKSIMGVLSLGIKQGETIYVIANGKYEKEAVAALEQIMQ